MGILEEHLDHSDEPLMELEPCSIASSLAPWSGAGLGRTVQRNNGNSFSYVLQEAQPSDCRMLNTKKSPQSVVNRNYCFWQVSK